VKLKLTRTSVLREQNWILTGSKVEAWTTLEEDYTVFAMSPKNVPAVPKYFLALHLVRQKAKMVLAPPSSAWSCPTWKWTYFSSGTKNLRFYQIFSKSVYISITWTKKKINIVQVCFTN
jgi:hypothetical protein